MPTASLPTAEHRVLSYRANGKLLLTGEYAVLDGALALALPTRLGQRLEVMLAQSPGSLHWVGYDHREQIWFQAAFAIPGLAVREASDDDVAERLQALLRSADAGDWDPTLGLRAETHLEFPRPWGLGSSSTLATLLAGWTGADPHRLHAESFGGSGYDLACARADGPILYQRPQGEPQFVRVPFDPPFADQLYFVWLGEKQDTRSGIARYRQGQEADREQLEAVSRLTQRVLCARSLTEFERAIVDHETLIGGMVDLEPVKTARFADFWGQVKSLGAWGGDFALVTSAEAPEATRAYFTERGYATFLPYHELILGA